MKYIIWSIKNRIPFPLLSWVYKTYKYILGYLTCTTELYRLCHSATLDSTQTATSFKYQCLMDSDSTGLPIRLIYQIEKSIKNSKYLTKEQSELSSEASSIEALIASISAKKRFLRDSAPGPEVDILRISLYSIIMTYTLQHTIQARTLTAYDSFNPVHEALLLQLWDVLMPHTSLEHRISHQWTEIGFQGDDPATDFRGMGMQGLDDLVYFAQTYPQVAKRVLGNASHGIGWYPFAIAGIHTTRFAVELMKNHQLQWFLYRHDVQTGYSEFYCSVFSMFDTFWTTHAPPLTVMDFEVAFKRFKTKVEVELWFDLLLPLEKERVVVDSIRDTVTVTTTAHPTLTQRKPIFL